MTVLGCILMVASIIGWVVLEKRKLERQAATLRASGAFDAPSPHRRRAPESEERPWLTSRSTFRHCRRRSRWVAPFMIGLSILCIIIVVIILHTDLEAPFIGPWG